MSTDRKVIPLFPARPVDPIAEIMRRCDERAKRIERMQAALAAASVDVAAINTRLDSSREGRA